MRALTGASDHGACLPGFSRKRHTRPVFYLEHENNVWTGAFDVDNFVFGRVKLPDGEEINPDDRLEERIEFQNTFRLALAVFFKKLVL